MAVSVEFVERPDGAVAMVAVLDTDQIADLDGTEYRVRGGVTSARLRFVHLPDATMADLDPWVAEHQKDGQRVHLSPSAGIQDDWDAQGEHTGDWEDLEPLLEVMTIGDG
jgi:hypothetical protein